MRYIWRDNLTLHHLSDALTAPATLTDHMRVDMNVARRLNFDNDFRSGSNGANSHRETVRDEDCYDYFSPPMDGSASAFLEEEDRLLAEAEERGRRSTTRSERTEKVEVQDFLSDDTGSNKNSGCSVPTMGVKYETEPSHIWTKEECLRGKEEIKTDLEEIDEKERQMRVGVKAEMKTEERSLGVKAKKQEQKKEERSISRGSASDGRGASCELDWWDHSKFHTECGSQIGD